MVSVYYEFLKNMWIMRRIDEVYLQTRVVKNQIDEVEYGQIVATEQINL